MKSRFKLLIVLYISTHKNLIRRKFMLHFPDFCSSCSYEFFQIHSGETLELAYVKFQFYLVTFMQKHSYKCAVVKI